MERRCPSLAAGIVEHDPAAIRGGVAAKHRRVTGAVARVEKRQAVVRLEAVRMASQWRQAPWPLGTAWYGLPSVGTWVRRRPPHSERGTRSGQGSWSTSRPDWPVHSGTWESVGAGSLSADSDDIGMAYWLGGDLSLPAWAAATTGPPSAIRLVSGAATRPSSGPAVLRRP